MITTLSDTQGVPFLNMWTHTPKNVISAPNFNSVYEENDTIFSKRHFKQIIIIYTYNPMERELGGSNTHMHINLLYTNYCSLLLCH